MTTRNLDSVFDQADSREDASPFWLLGKLAQALAPRCRARNRLGEPCGRPAQTGGEFCYWHTNVTGLREARSRRKALNPKQAHAKVMRTLWRTDPWTPGFTCLLEPEARQRLSAERRRSGEGRGDRRRRARPRLVQFTIERKRVKHGRHSHYYWSAVRAEAFIECNPVIGQTPTSPGGCD